MQEHRVAKVLREILGPKVLKVLKVLRALLEPPVFGLQMG
jgi:hypothetical protein